MSTKRIKYRVYDTVQHEWLATFRKPAKKHDVRVTKWTHIEEFALKFPCVAAAKYATEWLNDGGYGGCVIVDDRGVMV